MRVRLITALLIEAALSIGVRGEDRQSIAADPAALEFFWQLVQRANYGYSRLEQAAFIVRSRQGGLTCILWPDPEEPDIRRWNGSFPPGTVAIAHTHPNWTPRPSRIDVKTASHIGIPIFVITRSRVFMTRGKAPEIIAEGEWKPTSVMSVCRNASLH